MPLRVGVLGPVCAWRALTGVAGCPDGETEDVAWTAADGSGKGTTREIPMEEVPALGQPRQLAVLAVLAVRANLVVSRADLIDAVWGEHPPATAEGSVYTY